MRQPTQEKLGFRDEFISQRHRTWGFHCPAVDVDFLLLEYYSGSPVAIIDYKMMPGKPLNFDHPSFKALRKLCDLYGEGPLPFMVVYYSASETQPIFEILPMNDTAERLLARHSRKALSEREYVEILYVLRRRRIESDERALLSRLSSNSDPF